MPTPGDPTSTFFSPPPDPSSAGPPTGLAPAATPAKAPPGTAPDQASTLPERLPDGTTPTPHVLGGFRILGVIAQGGMGIVYKAYDPALGRNVALKTMRSGPLASPEEAERFQREARAVAQLRHAHIIRVYQFDQEGDQLYFTMDLAQGGSLAHHVEEFGGNPRAAAALVEKIARAVHYAHEHGILHRDLKPANVLLDERGEPLVSDFGVAKLLDEGAAALTRPGEVPGTPAYMAPEQASGRVDAVGPRTDVWALGIILYELLTGRRPFPGPGRQAALTQIQTTDPALPRSLKPGLDPILETVVLKCLRKDPARRYASAADLADDLGRWARGEPTLARPEGRIARLARALRRHPLLTAGTITAVVVTLGALAARPITDPDRPLRQLEKQLARGQETVLVSQRGQLAWSRWTLDPGLLRQAPDATLSLSGGYGLCLLELLPDPQRTHYRFSAQVQHDGGTTPLSSVGLYFAHSRQPGGQQFFCTFTFNDQSAALEGGLSAARLEIWRADSQALGSDRSPSLRQLPFKPAKQWRQLEVEISPDAVCCSWDGQPLPPVPSAELADHAASHLLAGFPACAPQFAPRDGLGLCVKSASASFRNVIVVPLD